MNDIAESFDHTWLKLEIDEHDGNCLWLEKSTESRVVYVAPRVKQVAHSQRIHLMTCTVGRSYGEFCKKIFGDCGQLLPTMYTKSLLSELHEKKQEVSVLNGMLDEVMMWSSQFYFEDRMKAYADNRPDMPPMDQVWHIAALAYFEKYEQVLSYQEMFAKGNRLNFLPIVTDEILDRAVDSAVRNLG